MFRTLLRMIAATGAGIAAAAVTVHLLGRATGAADDADLRSASTADDADSRSDSLKASPSPAPLRTSQTTSPEVDADKISERERDALLSELQAQL